jgi:hypothetical protein
VKETYMDKTKSGSTKSVLIQHTTYKFVFLEAHNSLVHIRTLYGTPQLHRDLRATLTGNWMFTLGNLVQCGRDLNVIESFNPQIQ